MSDEHTEFCVLVFCIHLNVVQVKICKQVKSCNFFQLLINKELWL